MPGPCHPSVSSLSTQRSGLETSGPTATFVRATECWFGASGLWPLFLRGDYCVCGLLPVLDLSGRKGRVLFPSVFGQKSLPFFAFTMFVFFLHRISPGWGTPIGVQRK